MTGIGCQPARRTGLRALAVLAVVSASCGSTTCTGTARPGRGAASARGRSFEPRVEAVSSSTVTLRWSRVAGATGGRVYLSAEPPVRAGAALTEAVEVARLRPGAMEHRIEGLAPAVHVFVRV